MLLHPKWVPLSEGKKSDLAIDLSDLILEVDITHTDINKNQLCIKSITDFLAYITQSFNYSYWVKSNIKNLKLVPLF